jgi:hypothetical protein
MTQQFANLGIEAVEKNLTGFLPKATQRFSKLRYYFVVDNGSVFTWLSVGSFSHLPWNSRLCI